MGVHGFEGILALSNSSLSPELIVQGFVHTFKQVNVKLGKDILDFLKLIHLVFTSLLILVSLSLFLLFF